MSLCIFCNGERDPIYRLGSFEIAQCRECLASSVETPPSEEEISAFYQGFSFQVDKKNLEKVLTPEVRNWMSSLQLPTNARMLDVGGGAGFFAHAFERFDLGESAYIDLDECACDFARSELGVKEVIHDRVENIAAHFDKTYDFIYCRHVIEHLVNPISMIDACIELLSPGGVFILQFPNGLSLEYFAFPDRLRPFARRLKHSNQLTLAKTVRLMLSKQNGFGLDPIRHLWAIPPDSIRRHLSGRSDLTLQTRTASVTDPVFSPYFDTSAMLQKFQAVLARTLFARLRGGAHGIVEIRKHR